MSVGKEIRVLKVTFDTKLQPWEVSGFRGAMAAKVGLEHEWFHNHDNSIDPGPAYHYRYPLIQYKLHKGKPMLLCVEQGVEEAQHFFSKPDWTLNINGKVHNMRIHRLGVDQHKIQFLEEPATYRIHNWLALNQEYFPLYQKARGIVARLQLLEKALKATFMAFCHHIGWEPEEQVEFNIVQEYEHKYISFKKVKMLAFNLDFQANVFIPDFIGLGKGLSHGFGVIKHYREYVQKQS
ncbi:MAG: CRISPR-associated endonuclease Cas6 [Aureispira sp.]|nr:CRISPR-associated endonuclease Cas6 [Aureispira sp.]